MANHKQHKIFIGSTTVIMLVIGLVLGLYWAKYLEPVGFGIVNLGLTLTAIILLLFIGSLILEIKDTLNNHVMQAKRRRK